MAWPQIADAPLPDDLRARHAALVTERAVRLGDGVGTAAAMIQRPSPGCAHRR